MEVKLKIRIINVGSTSKRPCRFCIINLYVKPNGGINKLMSLYHDKNLNQIREAVKKNGIVIIPTGSTEQHGPALPVSVDTVIVDEAARRAAAIVEKEISVLVTPPVWFGISTQHVGFTGTITARAQTYIALIIELCQSVVASGFKKILLLNGHGGNLDALRVASRMIRDEAEIFCAVARYWDFGAEKIRKMRQSEIGGMAHSGELEASCMMYLSPDLVSAEKLKKNVPKWHSKYVAQDLFDLGTITIPYNVHDVSSSGIVGDPDSASREKGEQFLEAIVEGLARFLTEFAAWDMNVFGKPDP
jgi:creatinine amidohydrolase